MKAPPSFQFYAKEFFITTRHLGAYGRGIFIDLLCLQWENGPLEDDPDAVAAMVGGDPAKVRELWSLVRAKFTNDGAPPGMMLNRRLEEVRAIRAEYKSRVQFESPIERKLYRALIVWLGQEAVQPQAPIHRYRVDFLVKRTLVVEADGQKWHSTPEQIAADAKRDEELRALGYEVLRFTGSAICRDAHQCAKVVADHFANKEKGTSGDETT